MKHITKRPFYFSSSFDKYLKNTYFRKSRGLRPTNPKTYFIQAFSHHILIFKSPFKSAQLPSSPFKSVHPIAFIYLSFNYALVSPCSRYTYTLPLPYLR